MALSREQQDMLAEVLSVVLMDNEYTRLARRINERTLRLTEKMRRQNDRLQSSTRRRYRPGMIVAMVIATLLIPAHAGGVPDSLFGNYHGAGKCPPAAKPCIDTGPLDNLYIGPAHIKQETAEEQRLRESFQIPKETPADAFIAIRVLRDNGHSCAFNGEISWASDRLDFRPEPPSRGMPNNCRLQLLFKGGTLSIKDPGNECSKAFCFYGKPPMLGGRRFKQGPDQLLVRPKKSTAPPPANIFGEYKGTGQCATDARKMDACRENKLTDYLVIEHSDSADAGIVLASEKRADEDVDYFCLKGAEGVWLGNHLAFIKERTDAPGRPDIVQFWFRHDTVVVRDVGRDHCATYFQGAYFKKDTAKSNDDAKR